MSDATTKRMLAPFVENAPSPLFLSSFFKATPKTYHSSQTVEIDVQRDGEDVAIAIVPGPGAGQNNNENNVFSNKEFEPPMFDEVFTVNAHKLMKRAPGENPFSDPDYQAAAIMRGYEGFVKLQAKIRRSLELMASQVLQTGKLDLINKAGAVIYTLDFQRKAALYGAAGAAWAADGSTGNPLLDINTRAALIRTHGRRSPDTLIFGDTAWTRFIKNADVRECLKTDGLNLGSLNPQEISEDATLQGVLSVGAYKYKCWTYSARYNHPQTGVSTPYVGDENLIMLSSKARMDLSFGRIPVLFSDKRVLDQLPARIMDSERGIDLTVHSWLESGGKELKLSAGTRPLVIPVEIDSFGCIDITP